jgi:hypothetical protein
MNHKANHERCQQRIMQRHRRKLAANAVGRLLHTSQKQNLDGNEGNAEMHDEDLGWLAQFL